MLLRHPRQRLLPAASVHALAAYHLEGMAADAVAERLVTTGEIRKRRRRFVCRDWRLRRCGDEANG